MSAPTINRIPLPTTPYRRFTWQEALVDYLPLRHQTARAFKWVERVPTAVILLLLVMLVLSLHNSAFIDEALYVNAGQDYLNHLLHGTAVPRHGDYFSGAPAVYPVLAAALDSIGGLRLVRAFSLLCVLVTTVMVQDTAQSLYRSRRVGLLAALAFALTGSVVFVAGFATFDALCILSLATALWLGVKKRGLLSGVGIGMALSLAVTVKYTGAAFVPVVLGVVLFAGHHSIRRVAVAVATVAAILVPAFLLYGESLMPGIRFTTSARQALTPASHGTLLVYLALNIGLLAVLALLGVVRSVRSWRRLVLTLGLLAGAALLPAAQLRLGEAVSFDKHTAYSALFLAPLAGFGLASVSRGLLKLAPVCLLALVALVAGNSRSHTLYDGWVNLNPVLSIIKADPQPGLYVSSSTDALKYYTRKTEPAVHWQTTFTLYAEGDAGIREAVADNRFQMVIVRSASTGSAGQDKGQRTLLEAVRENKRYKLVRQPFAVQRYSTDTWLVYRLTPAPPAPKTTAYAGDSLGSAATAPAVTTKAPKAPAPRPKPSYYRTDGTALSGAQVTAIRKRGHAQQHQTMRDFRISHVMLHKILGTPVKPF